jgi:hypothetical protein
MARHDTPRSFRFQPDEIVLLERLAEKHGGAKAAVIAGLRALEAQRELSNTALLRILKERLG